MRVLLIFIDGVGLGDPLPVNPFFFTETPSLQALLQGGPLCRGSAGLHDQRATLQALDACLGVNGLPQSATGQATIFSGVNAPRCLGAHLNGFPNRALREMLAEKGIFKQLKQQGYSCTFANAYRPPFFELLPLGLPGLHYSCSTLVTYYGDLPFHSLEQLREGKALYMDIDHTLLGQMEENIEQITPEEGGQRLAGICEGYDFTLFEYFLSDLAGHSADYAQAGRVVETLDRFIGSAARLLNPQETLLMVTSDHGNLEDLRHSEHTENPVPALLVGDEGLRRAIAPGMRDLTHILPAVQAALAWDPGQKSREGEEPLRKP